MGTEEATTWTDPSPVTPRDLLEDVRDVLGEKEATLRYLVQLLTRHSFEAYGELGAETLEAELTKLGVAQTRKLGVQVIEPHVVREALVRRQEERDLLADLDAVLGDRPVSARYALVLLARHSHESYDRLTTEALTDALTERGIPLTRHLGTWAIDPALVRAALTGRKDGPAVPIRLHPEHASDGAVESPDPATVIDRGGQMLYARHHGPLSPLERRYRNLDGDVPYIRLVRRAHEIEHHHLLMPQAAIVLGQQLICLGEQAVGEQDLVERVARHQAGQHNGQD